MLTLKRQHRNSIKGFTLIEVIVALGIIATAMAAVMMTVSANARNATGLKERTFAHWVAMNKMAELHIEDAWPSTNKKTGAALMAEHEWYWEQEAEKTEIETMRRVHIRVRLNKDDEYPMASLVGFVSRSN